jgi:hypothetical protein
MSDSGALILVPLIQERRSVRLGGMRTVVAVTTLSLALVSVAIAASTLVGSFKTKISGQTPATLNATWIVSFKSSHKYAIARNGAVVVRGRDTISGEKLTFGHETGPMACLGSQAAATYHWSLKGSKLTLKPVSETCSPRKIVLTTKPLTKIG